MSTSDIFFTIIRLAALYGHYFSCYQVICKILLTAYLKKLIMKIRLALEDNDNENCNEFEIIIGY